MNKTFRLLKKEIFCLVYVIAIILCLFRVGKVNKITNYNISGVSSILSSNLEKEYVPPVEEPIITEPEKYSYRLTSFYKDYCTGSGLCKNKFQLNDKGCYTYNGKKTPIGDMCTRVKKEYDKLFEELKLGKFL